MQGQFRKHIGVMKIMVCSWWLKANFPIILCQWVWWLSAKITNRRGWHNSSSQKAFSQLSIVFYHIFLLYSEHEKSHMYLALISPHDNTNPLLLEWKWFHIIMCHLTSGWRTDTLSSLWTWTWNWHVSNFQSFLVRNIHQFMCLNVNIVACLTHASIGTS